jgi:hypothetical protein
MIVGHFVLLIDAPLLLDAEVGCLWLALFGSGKCFVGFTDALMGFGCSRVTGLLGVYNSSNTPTCVTNDLVGTKCSQVLWL